MANQRVEVDVAVLGGGSAAERLAGALAGAGTSVAIVERHLVGGECPYYACIPSKVMLLTAALRSQLADAHEVGAAGAGVAVGDGAAAFRVAAERRDEAAAHHDDAGHVADLESSGVTVVRGSGRFDGPGRIVVDDGGVEVRAATLVLATGSSVVVPDVPGLAGADPWTFVEAWTATARPDSMLVIGAGAVGCEIAQTYARFGARVVLVQRSGLLGSTVEPETGEDLAAVLREDGVDVRTGTQAIGVTAGGEGWRVALDDGHEVVVDRVVVAAGKQPIVTGVGLERLGVDPADFAVDDRCRVVGVDGLYAIGDVTDVAQFTHTANYQGLVAARDILGRSARVDDRAIPRTVYTSPEVVAVGLTTAQARDAGVDVARIVFDLNHTARGHVDHERAGRLVLVADRARRVLIGASLVAPSAGELVSELALAIRAEVDVDVLADVVHPFPTWSEGIGWALRHLADSLDD